MNKDCKCSYCKNNVNERFCISCGYGFNSCESIYEVHKLHYGDLPTIGIPLCPKCCGEDRKPETYPGFKLKKKEMIGISDGL